MREGLVIDDNRQTADALKTLLDALDLPARVVIGAHAALPLLQFATPPFVCLDINMPGLDGSQFLALLRSDERLQHIPVIVISSDDQPHTRQRMLDAGAQAMITKPATLESLEGALRQAGVLPR